MRIRKEQLNQVIRPIIYALCLAIPEGLTTEDITYLLNNTIGLRQFNIDFNKIDFILKTYTYEGGRKVFTKQGTKWVIKQHKGAWNL